MKVLSLLAAALLPFYATAIPVAPEDGGPELVPMSVDANSGAEIFKRATRDCAIIGGSAQVNCRAGPGTSYKVNDIVYRGTYYVFTCVKSGECVTINGSKNCGWHKTGGCYVNGHYTDGSCTQAALGWC